MLQTFCAGCLLAALVPVTNLRAQTQDWIPGTDERVHRRGNQSRPCQQSGLDSVQRTGQLPRHQVGSRPQGDFSIGLNVTERYDSAPPSASAQKRDFQYAFSIGWSWS